MIRRLIQAVSTRLADAARRSDSHKRRAGIARYTCLWDHTASLHCYNRQNPQQKPLMKKILFLHGFTSSGDCEIAQTLKAELNGVAEITAPDLPLHPYEAVDMLQDLCCRERFDLIVGSSCGSFYGQQLVRLTGVPALLVSPFLRMTEFLEPRIGWHEYKSPRVDGRQRFEITPVLIEEFAEMQKHQFDCYDEFNRNRVWGMFGSQDTLAHFRNLFLEYYSIDIDYDGPHTMTADNVRNDMVSAIRVMLDEVKPIRERYFRHFKGGKYRLGCIAKDSETMKQGCDTCVCRNIKQLKIRRGWQEPSASVLRRRVCVSGRVPSSEAGRSRREGIRVPLLSSCR